MKIFCLSIFFLSALSANSQTKNYNIIGIWQEKGKSESSLNFVDSNTLVIRDKGIEYPSFNYTINYNPDSSLLVLDPKNLSATKTKGNAVIKFIDEDHIVIRLFLIDESPEMILERVVKK